MPTPKRYQSSDLDDEQYKKYNLDNVSKEINERIKLLKEQEKQNDELNKLLEQQKQEEDIDWDLINENTRKVNELTKNINSRSPTNIRTFAARRDPFDDINKNKEKLTPSPSNIPVLIPK